MSAVLSETRSNSPEKACLLALRAAHGHFVRNLVAQAKQQIALQPLSEKQVSIDTKIKSSRLSESSKVKPKSSDDLLALKFAELRGPDVYQLAEFYFLIEDTNQSKPDKMAAFIDRHNADMNTLAENPKRCRDLGIGTERVTDALITQGQKDRTLNNIEVSLVGGALSYRARFDQTVLGKLLSQVMAPETCRLSISLLSEFGFFTRKSFDNLTIVTSNGILESLFRDHMRHMLSGIESALVKSQPK